MNPLAFWITFIGGLVAGAGFVLLADLLPAFVNRRRAPYLQTWFKRVTPTADVIPPAGSALGDSGGQHRRALDKKAR